MSTPTESLYEDHEDASSDVPANSRVDERTVFEVDEPEHFLPVRRSDLITLLSERCDAALERPQFLRFCRMLGDTIHQSFRDDLVTLKNAYAPFNPDADTIRLIEPEETERERLVNVLFDGLRSLLDRANYRRLGEEDLQRALDAASYWGVHLDVDFDVFERLDVYARGSIHHKRRRKHPLVFYRSEIIEVPIFQRLVFVFQLRKRPRCGAPFSPNTIYLKVFKNIPQVDLDMLLPGARIKMSHLDHGKIWLPTLSGAGVAAFKLIKGVALLATLTMYNVFAFVLLVGGMLGYGIKSFFGYLRTKEKHQLGLTQTLYYQNLDNNWGVLLRLIDEAEEQEARESIVAYYLLWKHAPPEGLSAAELDRQAEGLIHEFTPQKVDFEVHDALEKLRDLRLASRDDAGRWSVVDPHEAVRRLDQRWDSLHEVQ